MDLKRWFRRRPSDEDLREEMDAHLAMRAEHDGSDSSAAKRRFGNVLRTQEETRRVWVADFFDTLAQDTLFTWRSWRRNPAFAVAGVLVLALGMGAATALFSALDRILFRPLPYPDAGRLVSFGYQLPRPDGTPGPETMPDKAYFGPWQPAPEPFTSVSVVFGAAPCDVVEEHPERLLCAGVEHTFLRTLSVRVALGRDFTAQDDTRGAPRAILLTHKLWQRRFRGDPGVIGRSMNLDGRAGSIIGVLPVDFEAPFGVPDILYPAQLTPFSPSQQFTRFFTGIGKLKPSVSPERAQAALQTQMLELLPAMRLPTSAPFTVRPLQDRLMGDAKRTGWLLLGAVGGLLLIACVNVASLMLARVSSRQREFAVRSALGAGKLRLARLALTESLLLAFTAGAVGLGIAAGLLKVFVAMAPVTIPKIDQAGLDMRVFLTAAVLALVAGMAAGIWPAISILRAGELHGSRTTGGVRPTVRFALVTMQIGLTIAMLGGSALLVRSLWNMASVPLGFDAEHVLTASVALTAARYPAAEQRSLFFNQLLESVRKTPGTVAAALSDAPPLGISMTIRNLAVEGRLRDASAKGPSIRVREATPQYFETFRIPLLQGRGFVEDDLGSAEPPAVLSASLAGILFGGQGVLGQRVRISDEGPWQVVVGISQNLRNNGFRLDAQPELYLLRPRDETSSFASLVVRTMARTADATAFLTQAAAELDPQLPVTIQTAGQQVAALTERPRFLAWLLAAFAGIALLVAAGGLYGVAGYLVTQRTRDIGVRMTLGAAPADIARQVVGEAGRWIVAGAAGGCVVGWFGTRALESQLFGVGAGDVLSWGASLVVLAGALLVAVWRPAVRAARVNPVVALRAE